MALFPEHMRARQRGMSTQVHFHGGREPAQMKAILLPMQKGGLGQVHLLCHLLHPLHISWLWQDTDCRWIAPKGGIRKRIHLRNRLSHRVSSLLLRAPTIAGAVL